MKEFNQGLFTGERALYAQNDLKISDSVFADGESHLKESQNIELSGCLFKWKYPLWNCKGVKVENTTLLQTARSGIWYTHGIEMKDCTIDAPKTFRRSSGITLKNCTMPYAEESLWSCKNITLDKVSVTGDYFGVNCEGVNADKLMLSGNYVFDGGRNITVKNSRLISKDAFWNCENVTVENSVIIGEYLGWNSKNLTFINCTIESNQGLCYIDGLKLKNCKLINTDLAFEYCSDIDAEITTEIISVKNPQSGRIKAKDIGKIILDPAFCDPKKTDIITD